MIGTGYNSQKVFEGWFQFCMMFYEKFLGAVRFIDLTLKKFSLKELEIFF